MITCLIVWIYSRKSWKIEESSPILSSVPASPSFHSPATASQLPPSQPAEPSPPPRPAPAPQPPSQPQQPQPPHLQPQQPQPPPLQPLHFRSAWDVYIHLLLKNKWILLGILIFVPGLIYLFLSSQAPIYEATTRIMVHQKPGAKFVANTYLAEQASNTMSTALVQIILTDDFEEKVLASLLKSKPQLYPLDLVAKLKNSSWLGLILNKKGVIDGNYIRRLPVVSIFTIGQTPEQAVALGELASQEIISQAREIYGDADSVDLRMIDSPKVLDDKPIFPQTKEALLFITAFTLILELFIGYIIAESKFYHHH